MSDDKPAQARPRRRRLRREPFLVRLRRELTARWADHLVMLAVAVVVLLLLLLAAAIHIRP